MRCLLAPREHGIRKYCVVPLGSQGAWCQSPLMRKQLVWNSHSLNYINMVDTLWAAFPGCDNYPSFSDFSFFLIITSSRLFSYV